MNVELVIYVQSNEAKAYFVLYMFYVALTVKG